MENQADVVAVVAHFTAQAGKEKALETTLRGLVEPTRREPGCLRYELNQEIENPAAFTFAEKFRNRAAFDAHGQTAHIKSFAAQVGDLAQSRLVRVHREILPAAAPERAAAGGEQIIVIAHFTAKPGKEEELAKFFESLVEPTRKEPGCIRYELNRDVKDPATFSFVETFADRGGFDAHCKMPYIGQLFETLPRLAGEQYIGLHKRLH